MERILWVKFGWSEYYRGEAVDGNFEFLEGNQGHEAYNFKPAADGTYYCYVPPQFGHLSPGKGHTERSGWTVVCLAKQPKRTGIHIVGWYNDATLLGRFENVPESRAHRPVSRANPNARWRYCLFSKTAFFVPPKRRTIPFSHPSVGSAKYSFLSGPGVDVTKNKEEVLAKLRRRIEALGSVVIKNPTGESAPDPDALRRFRDDE